MRNRNWWAPLAVIAVSLLVRLIFLNLYEPVYFADSPHYEWLAENIRQGDFADYEGVRAPVYSLLLLVAGLNWRLVWILQSLLGVLTGALLYSLTSRALPAQWPAIVVALLPTIQLNLLFAEANILTESLALFLLILSLWLWQHGESRGWSPFLALLCGLTATCAGLTRPLLLLLPLLMVIWSALVWLSQRRHQTSWRPLLFLTLPFVLLTGGWSLFNWHQVDYFGPTTLTGYNLIRHTGDFVEYAPDRFATVRDIYLSERPQVIAERGEHTGTIWRVRREMQAATGLTYAGLSKELTRLSWWLIMNRPFNFLRGAFEAWTWFWDKTILWQLGAVEVGWLQPILAIVWWLEARLLLAIDVIFWSLSAIYLWRFFRRQPIRDKLSAFILVLILLTSISQALLEYGENARYAIPFQPLIIYVTIVAIWPWLRTKPDVWPS